MKKHFVLRNLLIDLICAGLALIVFALFHHVLPRQQQGLGIVITNPNVKDSGNNTGESVMSEGVWLTASAGISDTSSGLSARGGRGRRGKSGQFDPSFSRNDMVKS